GHERLTPAEEQRVGVAQQFRVVLVECLVLAVVLVEVVEESVEGSVGRLVITVKRLEVGDDEFPHVGRVAGVCLSAWPPPCGRRQATPGLASNPPMTGSPSALDAGTGRRPSWRGRRTWPWSTSAGARPG